jgi:hypothetical protein
MNSMKRVGTSLSIVGIVALLALAVGCTTTTKRENLLSAAGFKMVPAATPEQKSHLQTLPPGKVTMVQREGKTYFVFPDRKQQVLYVGQQAQYDEYQKLRLQNQLAQDQMNAAELNSEPAWGVWGGWEGTTRVFRR